MVALLVLAVGMALAEEFVLEGPPFKTRAEATALEQVATAQSLPTSVTRRFVSGTGWEYVVKVDGFEERLPAAEAAQALANASGRAIAVVGPPVAGSGEADRVWLNPADRPTTLPPAVASPADDLAAVTVLQGLLAAQGASGDPRAQLKAAANITFRFRRSTSDGQVVAHTWVARGADRAVLTAIEAGEGTSSRAVVAAGKAYLAPGGGGAAPSDLVRTQEIIAGLAPDAILGLGLGVSDLLDRASLVSGARVVGVTTVSGQPCRVLAVPDASGGPPLLLAVDEGRGLVLQAASGGTDPTVVSFEDHAPLLGDALVPRRVRIAVRDAVIEEITVLELNLAADPPPELFRVP